MANPNKLTIEIDTDGANSFERREIVVRLKSQIEALVPEMQKYETRALIDKHGDVIGLVRAT